MNKVGGSTVAGLYRPYPPKDREKESQEEERVSIAAASDRWSNPNPVLAGDKKKKSSPVAARINIADTSATLKGQMTSARTASGVQQVISRAYSAISSCRAALILDNGYDTKKVKAEIRRLEKLIQTGGGKKRTINQETLATIRRRKAERAEQKDEAGEQKAERLRQEETKLRRKRHRADAQLRAQGPGLLHEELRKQEELEQQLRREEYAPELPSAAAPIPVDAAVAAAAGTGVDAGTATAEVPAAAAAAMPVVAASLDVQA